MRHHVLVAAIVGLVVGIALACMHSVPAVAQEPRQSPPQQPQRPQEPSIGKTTDSAAACSLRQDMRKLWTDHVVWTRDYIIAAVDDKPDQEAAAKRLMKNQEDIGNAIAPFYTQEAGEKLTTLLKQHISIAVDLIKAAKAQDKAKVSEIDQTWQANGNEIAAFLSKANPNWPQATLADMMRMHLRTTTNEVTARLNKKWDDDVRAYDEVYDHILRMSDALSEGIIKQFPDRF